MTYLSSFCEHLANENMSELDRTIALIWFQTEIMGEHDCTVNEVCEILHSQSFSTPNPSRLKKNLSLSNFTVKGSRDNSYRIHKKSLVELSNKYATHARKKIVKKTDSIIPHEWVENKGRSYLEKLASQINGSFDAGYYDASAILIRRMMESLIIDVYLKNGKESEIKKIDKTFVGLEELIKKIVIDFPINKNAPNAMKKIKQTGDTAAHDRKYITMEADIDAISARKIIYELLELAKIIT